VPTTTLITTTLRRPGPADGADLHTLVREGGGLDVNSPYAYLLMARSFAATSIVAEDDAGLAGFVFGFRQPDEPSALFVWQVATAPRRRGEGLGRSMLEWLVDEVGPTHLEATVTPSNAASDRLFRGLARDRGTACAVTPWAAADDFPGAGHEREDRYRIGPFTT
jgi:L-2,4-diaminobutyric acid acetyltransferase